MPYCQGVDGRTHSRYEPGVECAEHQSMHGATHACDPALALLLCGIVFIVVGSAMWLIGAWQLDKGRP